MIGTEACLPLLARTAHPHFAGNDSFPASVNIRLLRESGLSKPVAEGRTTAPSPWAPSGPRAPSQGTGTSAAACGGRSLPGVRLPGHSLPGCTWWTHSFHGPASCIHRQEHRGHGHVTSGRSRGERDTCSFVSEFKNTGQKTAQKDMQGSRPPEVSARPPCLRDGVGRQTPGLRGSPSLARSRLSATSMHDPH